MIHSVIGRYILEYDIKNYKLRLLLITHIIYLFIYVFNFKTIKLLYIFFYQF